MTTRKTSMPIPTNREELCDEIKRFRNAHGKEPTVVFITPAMDAEWLKWQRVAVLESFDGVTVMGLKVIVSSEHYGME